jgi:hypothetical protein
MSKIALGAAIADFAKLAEGMRKAGLPERLGLVISSAPESERRRRILPRVVSGSSAVLTKSIAFPNSSPHLRNDYASGRTRQSDARSSLPALPAHLASRTRLHKISVVMGR